MNKIIECHDLAVDFAKWCKLNPGTYYIYFIENLYSPKILDFEMIGKIRDEIMQEYPAVEINKIERLFLGISIYSEEEDEDPQVKLNIRMDEFFLYKDEDYEIPGDYEDSYMDLNDDKFVMYLERIFFDRYNSNISVTIQQSKERPTDAKVPQGEMHRVYEICDTQFTICDFMKLTF